uniref:ATPase domain-containing protein n=1 Tax=uncultured prokaryote TaxID=198431 RepID=H5SKC9_9ZZZZ|nr:hypothetical protein HGMM_F41E03C26 [uncultured prokaryote]
MRPPNPYNYNLPVEPEMFFGRDADVETLVRSLTGAPGDSFALVGGRRMGKTSLLEALKRALTGPVHHLLPVPVLLDMSGEQVDSLPAFFRAVVGEAEEALADRLGCPPEAPGWDETRPPVKVFERWLRACNEAVMGREGRGLRLVLLLDECEQIVGGPWTPDLYSGLRALLVGEATRLHLKVVMAGSHRFLAQYLMHHLWEQGLERATPEEVRRLAARFPHERDDFRVWAEGLGDSGCRVYGLLVRAGC